MAQPSCIALGTSTVMLLASTALAHPLAAVGEHAASVHGHSVAARNDDSSKSEMTPSSAVIGVLKFMGPLALVFLILYIVQGYYSNRDKPRWLLRMRDAWSERRYRRRAGHVPDTRLVEVRGNVAEQGGEIGVQVPPRVYTRGPVVGV